MVCRICVVQTQPRKHVRRSSRPSYGSGIYISPLKYLEHEVGIDDLPEVCHFGTQRQGHKKCVLGVGESLCVAL